MSKLIRLRVLVNERLTAAAEEIFALFERTMAEYEEELCRSEKENQRKQRLLDDALNPRVQQPRAGSSAQIPCPSPPGPGLNQEITKTAQIKEEPEEQSVKQEEEVQQPWFVPEFMVVCVKTEETPQHQQIQTEHREEAQEEDIGSEPHLHSETEGDTEHSSDTNNDHVWKCPDSPADSQMETGADGNHDNQGQFSEYKSVPEISAAVTETDEGSGGKKHQCPFCEKRFLNNHKLETHMRVHTGERPYGCSLCEKTFNQKGNLKRHLRTHTEQTLHNCSLCNKRFTQSFHLSTHMRTHTGEKLYSCSLCSKKFTQSSNLRTHLRTHTGEKPHRCLICKKTFGKKGNLKVHMRTHTGDKPFNCSVCEKTFTQKSQLTIHMRTHEEWGRNLTAVHPAIKGLETALISGHT